MTRYMYSVETYAADGHGEQPRVLASTLLTLDDARTIARDYLGVRRLDPRRRWYPSDDYAVEGYHDLPRSNPHSQGCGGVIIYAEPEREPGVPG